MQINIKYIYICVCVLKYILKLSEFLFSNIFFGNLSKRFKVNFSPFVEKFLSVFSITDIRNKLNIQHKKSSR